MGFPVFPLLWTNEQGETSRGYREDGYIPEAVVNMLALLGWNPGIEQEIFTLDQLAEHFDLNRVGKSGSKFDPDKAKWFNQQYLRMMPDEELAQLFSNELKSKGIDAPFEKVLNITTLIKERVQFAHELWSQSFFLFEAPEKFEEKVVAKHWKPEIPGLMLELSALLTTLDVFEREPIHHSISEWLNTKGIGMGKVMNPLRLAITGDALGPDLISMLVVLGKQETLNRIQFAVQNIVI
jgi:glutamyl-tRNA synthetase